MGFTQGNSNGQDDGGVGTTSSETMSGLVGRNDSIMSANAPAGSGVFGVTTVVEGAGVFGSNNSIWTDENGVTGPGIGVGVQGNGPTAGVSGWSDNASGYGVRGLSDNVGVFGQGGNLGGYFVGGTEVDGPVRVHIDYNGEGTIDLVEVVVALVEALQFNLNPYVHH